MSKARLIFLTLVGLVLTIPASQQIQAQQDQSNPTEEIIIRSCSCPFLKEWYWKRVPLK